MSIVDALRDGWSWTGLDFAEVQAVSPMGHVIFADREGCHYHLEPEMLTITALGNQEAAEKYFADPETAEIWRASGLVDPARERLGECPEGSVYCQTPAALIEGIFDPAQMITLPLEELIRFAGDVARQIKDLPDGSKIRIEIVD